MLHCNSDYLYRLCTLSKNNCYLAFTTSKNVFVLEMCKDGTNVLQQRQLFNTLNGCLIKSLVFSPNSKYLSVNMIKEIIIFDMSDRNTPKSISINRQCILSAAFSPCSRFIALAILNSNVIIREIEYNRTREIDHTEDTNNVTWSNCGKYFASSTNSTVSLYNSNYDFLNYVYSIVNADIKSILFSPDDSYIVIVTYIYCDYYKYTTTRHEIVILNTDDWNVEKIINYKYNPYLLVFNPDGTQFVANSLNGNIDVWSVVDEWNHQRTIVMHCPLSILNSLCFTSDGKYLIAAYNDGIKIFSINKCWSDKVNNLFFDNLKSVIFYMMCVFNNGHLGELPIEMLLEILQSTSVFLM